MSRHEVRTYGLGTSTVSAYPWGLYVRARVMCSDGRVRATSRLASTADTFFSVPAAVRVAGRTVSGYLTVDDVAGVPVACFVAYSYGRNGALLPAGVFGREVRA